MSYKNLSQWNITRENLNADELFQVLTLPFIWILNSTEHIQAPLHISKWTITRVVKKWKRTWTWKLHLCIFIVLDNSKFSFFSPNLSKEESKRICAREWLQISQNGEHRTTENTPLQKTAFSLVKSRLALGSPGCSFVRSFDWLSPCWEWPNTQEWLLTGPYWSHPKWNPLPD